MLKLRYPKEKSGEILRQGRKKKGYRQEDVAQKLDVSISTISNWEKGYHMTNEEGLYAYAELLDLTEELFGTMSEIKRMENTLLEKLYSIELIIQANPEESLKRIDQLNEVTPLEENSTLAPITYYLLCRCYYELRKWKQAEKFALLALQKIESLTEMKPEFSQTNLKPACLNILSIRYYFKNNIHKALKYIEEGICSFHQNGERQYQKYLLYLNKAIYLKKLNYEEKTLQTLEDLQRLILEAKNNANDLQTVRTSVISQYYEMHATVLLQQNMTDKALKLAQKGFKIAWLNQEYDRIFTLWTTIGDIYSKKGDLKKAKELYENALAIKSKVRDESLYITTHISIGKIFILRQKFDLAMEHLQKALSYSTNNNDPFGKIKTLEAMGKCYLEEQHYNEALKLFKQAESMAQEQQLLPHLLRLTDLICMCYDGLENKEDFHKYAAKAFYLRQQLAEGGDEV